LDEDTQTIRLLDYKGRRSKPRQHHVPLIPAAVDALNAMNAGAIGPYLFTLTAGESGADYSGIFKRVRAVAAAMESAGELPGGSFTPGDLRRTVETVLSGKQVSKEARAHLQSHGLGGVQDRHYDKHTYLSEKRSALNALYRLLTTGRRAKKG
jgi:integrase